jgi:hypothetical protein
MPDTIATGYNSNPTTVTEVVGTMENENIHSLTMS